MAIIVNLDVMMAKRKIALGDLADRIGITPANLSILKTGKAKAIRSKSGTYINKSEDTINTAPFNMIVESSKPADILEFKDEES